MNKQTQSLLLYVLITGATLEGLARLDNFSRTLIDPPFESIVIKDAYGQHGKPYGVWKNLKINPYGPIRLNRYGFNDSDDYVRESKGAALRIVCLGDSITFATQTSPHNWPNQLEQLLKENNLDVEVINAAFPGNTYAQLVERFAQTYAAFKPDVVIVYKGFRAYMGHGIRHAALDQDWDGQRNLAPNSRHWRDWLRRLAVVRTLLDPEPADAQQRLQWLRKRRHADTLINTVAEDAYTRYAQDLTSLAQLCQDHGIQLVLASFPNQTSLEALATAQTHANTNALTPVYNAITYYPWLTPQAYLNAIPRFNAVTQRVAQTHRLVFVDLVDAIAYQPDYFIDDYHLTTQGSQRVAQRFAQTLLRGKIGR